MLRALYSAASGMSAQQLTIETISHNLANVNTTGFKKSRAEFQDLLYAHVQPAVGDQEKGIQIGQGARLSNLHRILAGGTLQLTGNPYDLAISGEGFFRVQRPDGSEAYTRDGSFRLDGDRRLTTVNGDLLLGKSGPITIPEIAENVEVAADGTIRYTDSGAAADQASVELDQLQLAVFRNASGLEPLGNNLMGQTTAAGEPALHNPGEKGAGRLAAGQLETSNVQTVDEMVNLIAAQRAYEINAKVAQSADEMMSLANNLRRG